MDMPTRIGLGGTALFTLAGVGAPIVTWWVSGPIMIVCAGVAAWGFWPLLSRIVWWRAVNTTWKPMFEAVAHVAKHIDDDNTKECFPKARQAIRQAALDKEITIRGKISAELMAAGSGYSEVETDIPVAYWETADIGPMATDKAALEMPHHTFPHKFSNGRYGDKILLYAKLRIRWDEILKKWPS